VRIISGKYRSKQILAPAGLPARPTTDFAKTGLFNVLNNLIDYENISALDLFSGTGNITYELVSRGCKSITAVDIDRHCIKFIESTIGRLNAANVSVVKSDVFSYLMNSFNTFDLIFADPPFNLEEAEKIPAMVFNRNLLNSGGLLVLEHAAGKNYKEHPGFRETRKYGNVSFSFFRQNIHDN
jgi:16S rRNA (guanine966-N2)-methyltransferase